MLCRNIGAVAFPKIEDECPEGSSDLTKRGTEFFEALKDSKSLLLHLELILRSEIKLTASSVSQWVLLILWLYHSNNSMRRLPGFVSSRMGLKA